MTLTRVRDEEGLRIIETLAQEILPEAYDGIIAPDHITYMIKLFFAIQPSLHHLNSPNHYYYLINIEDRPVGFMHFEQFMSEISLHKLYILKSARNQRLGTKALDMIEEVARTNEIPFIGLTVHNLNTNAFELYKKRGFRIEIYKEHTFDNGHLLTGYRMIKSIPN